MDNKFYYNDNRLVDDKTASEMAIAYTSMVKALENANINPNEDKSTASTNTIETLLTEILTELKLIREQMSINKRIRLS